MQLDFGGCAAGFALIRDLEAFVDRGDQIVIGLFHGVDIKHTTFHFLTHDFVGFAQVGRILREQLVGQVVGLAHSFCRLAGALDRDGLRQLGFP